MLCGYFKQIFENPKFSFGWEAGPMVKSVGLELFMWNELICDWSAGLVM